MKIKHLQLCKCFYFLHILFFFSKITTFITHCGGIGSHCHYRPTCKKLAQKWPPSP
nr:MAG TPA: actin cytoskeleton-regulatory complex protein [Caudoviricetes sp.]